jgi:8-oxo-dGTP pyrophosphatase MutT (NUDIX family)
MPVQKKSYGLICRRRSPQHGTQFLMVKKTVTYHFCEFVSAHYRRNDDSHIKKLFNNMTYHEKMDILSMNFNTMWYRIYNEVPDRLLKDSSNGYLAQKFFYEKGRFEKTFLIDNGARLKRLITDSTNGDMIWEFPKGRKSDVKESDLQTAIREFYEETGICSKDYTILWHCPPYVECYTDFGVTYKNIYYLADALDPNLEPVYKFANQMQCSEVSAVRWLSKKEITHMILDPVAYRRMVRSFEKIKKKGYKGQSKNLLQAFYLDQIKPSVSY